MVDKVLAHLEAMWIMTIHIVFLLEPLIHCRAVEACRQSLVRQWPHCVSRRVESLLDLCDKLDPNGLNVENISVCTIEGDLQVSSRRFSRSRLDLVSDP
jgi:hypothetical protein